MKLIIAYIQPDRLNPVKQALYARKVFKISVTNALGYPILGMIYDRTGKYDGALILVFTMMLISVAGVLLVYRLAGRSAGK